MIRLAVEEDLPVIQNTYQIAKEFMIKNGNETQWGKGFPPIELLKQDIQKKQLYVVIRQEEIQGVFAFFIGEDETYQRIEDGNWISNEPYGVIHRLASSGKEKGIFEECVQFCQEKWRHLRIDTHENNKVMQHLILKFGFQRCGIIYVRDGSPRIAYELV